MLLAVEHGRDGKPLAAGEDPFRVMPDEKEPIRWAEQVQISDTPKKP